MGGFHLIEPVEEQSPTLQGADSLEARATSEDRISGQSTSSAAGEPTRDVEKGSEGKAGPEKGRVLTLEMLKELVKDRNFKIRITEDEITDKAKGDELSKFIFMVQSSWFIVQCIARLIQRLYVTQLELATLALASLNGITFILWWDKPLGARTPVRVYLERKLKDAEINAGVSRLLVPFFPD